MSTVRSNNRTCGCAHSMISAAVGPVPRGSGMAAEPGMLFHVITGFVPAIAIV